MTEKTGGTEQVLEEAFADEVGSAQAVAVASGAGALAVGLALVGITRGAEVGVSALAATRVLEGIALLGAVPRCGDVDAHTFTLSAAHGALRLTGGARAIVAEHVAGAPCDVEALAGAASVRGLPIVEDATEAFGALVRGRPVGGHGRPVAFAFAGVGLLAVPDGNAAELGRALRGTLGGIPEQHKTRAALAGLRLAEREAAARAHLALRLRSALAGMPGLLLPVLDAGVPGRRAWSRFIVRAGARRDALCEALRAAGIAARTAFELRAGLPEAERVAGDALEITLEAALTFDEAAAEAFAGRVRAVFESGVGTRP